MHAAYVSRTKIGKDTTSHLINSWNTAAENIIGTVEETMSPPMKVMFNHRNFSRENWSYFPLTQIITITISISSVRIDLRVIKVLSLDTPGCIL